MKGMLGEIPYHHSPPFGVFEVAIICPKKLSMFELHISKGAFVMSQFLTCLSSWLAGPYSRTKCGFWSHDYVSLAGYFHHPSEKILPRKHRMEPKTAGLFRVIFRWSIAVNFAECMLVKDFIPISSQKNNIHHYHSTQCHEPESRLWCSGAGAGNGNSVASPRVSAKAWYT